MKNNQKLIRALGWFLLILFIIVLTLLLSSSYLFFGPMVGPKGLEFLGRPYLNSQDTYTYLSFTEQARQGNWLFKNLYTPELSPALFFRPVYLLAGFWANLFNLSNMIAFHLTRIGIGLVFLLAAWKFLGLFFERKSERLTTFAILCLSSGFGFFVFKWFPDSTDLWIPEGNTFLSLADSPHFIFSQLLIIGIFGLFLISILKNRLFPAVLAGGLMLLLSFDHPFDPPVVILTLIFYAGTLILRDLKISRRLILIIVFVTIPAFIGLGFYYWAMKIYPTIGSWEAQNNLLSPDFYYFLLGYGLLWPLAILGVKRIFVHNEYKALLLLSWVLACVVLLYSPLGPQRRFANSLHIPIVILAGFGLPVVLEKVNKYFSQLRWNSNIVSAVFVLLLVSFLFTTNGFAIYQDWKVFKADKIDNYYYYLPRTELAAINWLKNNTQKDVVIGTNWFYGNLIPGLTGQRVFLGHRIQTINPDEKIKEIGNFVNTDTDKQARDFLKKWGINYFFFGVGDSLLRGHFKPEEKSYLQKIYDQYGDKIFKVI